MQGKTKDDLSTIELRKRMLQSFLNRIAAHELLCAEHVFHRFLEPGAWVLLCEMKDSWMKADVLFSQSIDKKERIGEDNIHTSTSFGTSSIPVPTTTMLGVTRKLKNPDSKFLDCERFIANFDEQIQAIERSSRKISKKTDELAGTYGELGAVFNAFSLHENNSQLLANAIEKVGQAMDSTYLSTNSMVFPIPFHSAESMFMQLRDVGEKYLEPVHEHLQFVDSVKVSFRLAWFSNYSHLICPLQSVLKNRLQKHLLYEDLGDQLESKRFQLNNIDHQPSSGNSASSPSNPLSPAAPTFPEQRSSGIGGGIGKMMGKLGGKIQNMIDNDPEMTRRKQSARLRDTITQVLLLSILHRSYSIDHFRLRKREMMRTQIFYACLSKLNRISTDSSCKRKRTGSIWLLSMRKHKSIGVKRFLFAVAFTGTIVS